MAGGAAALTGCALAFLSVALVHYSFGRRRAGWAAGAGARARRRPWRCRSRRAAPALRRSLFSRRLEVDHRCPRRPQSAGVALILHRRRRRSTSSPPSTLQGKLPNFGRILDSGAAMHLATFGPRSRARSGPRSPPASCPGRPGSARRHAIDSGRGRPSRPAPRQLLRARARALRPRRATTHTRRRRCGQDVVEHPRRRRARRPASSNWPLTLPGQPVRGYLVSDRFYRPADPWLEPDDPRLDLPPRPAARRPGCGRPGAQEPGVRDSAGGAADGRPAPAGRRGTARAHRPHVRTDCAGPSSAFVRPHLTAVRLRQLDFSRPPVPALRLPAPVRRRDRGRAPALRRGPRAGLLADRRDGRASHGVARPRRPAARGVRFRHGAHEHRQAPARARAWRPRVLRARTRTRPTASCWPRDRCRAGPKAARRRCRRRRRPCSTFWGCQWPATWTATPGPTVQPGFHRSTARWRSSPPTSNNRGQLDSSVPDPELIFPVPLFKPAR